MTKDRMSTQDIVKKQCERNGDDFNQVYSDLYQQIEDNVLRILRSGNTLLAYQITNPHEADIFLITADAQPQIVQALSQFYQGMKKAGFVRATATLKTPVIASMLRSAGIPFSQNGENQIVIGD